MIAYLSGKIILKKDNFIILETNGIGYEVFVSTDAIENIPNAGEALKLFCYLDVNERSLRLFGFETFQELELFKILRGISGIGPRASLEISAIGSLEKIKQEIEKTDSEFFENIPGIGRKKAQKIVLELSGKIKNLEPKSNQQDDTLNQDETFLALVQLGFSKDQAKQAINNLPKNITNTQEKVKYCLTALRK